MLQWLPAFAVPLSVCDPCWRLAAKVHLQRAHLCRAVKALVWHSFPLRKVLPFGSSENSYLVSAFQRSQFGPCLLELDQLMTTIWAHELRGWLGMIALQLTLDCWHSSALCLSDRSQGAATLGSLCRTLSCSKTSEGRAQNSCPTCTATKSCQRQEKLQTIFFAWCDAVAPETNPTQTCLMPKRFISIKGHFWMPLSQGGCRKVFCFGSTWSHFNLQAGFGFAVGLCQSSTWKCPGARCASVFFESPTFSSHVLLPLSFSFSHSFSLCFLCDSLSVHVSAQIYSEIRDAAEAGQLDRQQAGEKQGAEQAHLLLANSPAKGPACCLSMSK